MEKFAKKNKDDKYWQFLKWRIVDAIPQGANTILDIGCANGRLGRRLRELNKAGEMVGIEIFPDAAAEAEHYYDVVHRGDIEKMDLPYRNYFDFVICGDILEHLQDPWQVVLDIKTWLKDDGLLICSIPNIRYWRILRDLVLLGRWDYKSAGILDIGHLRFFTARTFRDLINGAGFMLVNQEMWVDGKKQGIFNKISFRVFEEYLGAQFMTIGKKTKTNSKAAIVD